MSKIVRGPFGRGLLAGLVAGLAMLGLRSFVHALSLQELIAERSVSLLSPRAFSFLLNQVWSLGKILSVIGITAGLAAGGGVLGLVYTQLLRKGGLIAATLGLALSITIAAELLVPRLLDAGTAGQHS